MKKLILILFLSFINISFSQYLILKGKVYNRGKVQDKKIYFTFENEEFNAKKYIITDMQGNYIFKIKIKQIKKHHSNKLVFALDTTAKINYEYSCIERINIESIINSDANQNTKKIEINTDLILDRSCIMEVYREANEENLIHFTGKYKLTYKDTVFQLNLQNEMFKVSGISHPHIFEANKEINGSWWFREDKGILAIYLNYFLNTELDLIIYEPRRFEFQFSESEGKMIFKSEKATLIKL